MRTKSARRLRRCPAASLDRAAMMAPRRPADTIMRGPRRSGGTAGTPHGVLAAGTPVRRRTDQGSAQQAGRRRGHQRVSTAMLTRMATRPADRHGGLAPPPRTPVSRGARPPNRGGSKDEAAMGRVVRPRPAPRRARRGTLGGRRAGRGGQDGHYHSARTRTADVRGRNTADARAARRHALEKRRNGGRTNPATRRPANRHTDGHASPQRGGELGPAGADGAQEGSSRPEAPRIEKVLQMIKAPTAGDCGEEQEDGGEERHRLGPGLGRLPRTWAVVHCSYWSGRTA